MVCVLHLTGAEASRASLFSVILISLLYALDLVHPVHYIRAFSGHACCDKKDILFLDILFHVWNLGS